MPVTKRKVTLGVIHCTANAPYVDVGVKEIRHWHKKRNFSDIGYHFVIRRNGKLEVGRPIDKIGAHAKDYNRGSIGVALVGGLGNDNRPAPKYTRAQWSTLKKVVRQMQNDYPGIKITGHNTLSAKACPSFDVEDWMKDGTITPRK